MRINYIGKWGIVVDICIVEDLVSNVLGVVDKDGYWVFRWFGYGMIIIWNVNML